MTAAVDANVLLYASDETSSRQRRAVEAVQRLAAGPEALYLFWPVVMAYVRLATHPTVFEEPLTLAEALGNVGDLLARPHVPSPTEDDGFWSLFGGVAVEAAVRGNLVPDAHLVALMRRHGVRNIVTRDRDFRRFDGVTVVDPFA